MIYRFRLDKSTENFLKLLITEISFILKFLKLNLNFKLQRIKED